MKAMSYPFWHRTNGRQCHSLSLSAPYARQNGLYHPHRMQILRARGAPLLPLNFKIPLISSSHSVDYASA